VVGDLRDSTCSETLDEIICTLLFDVYTQATPLLKINPVKSIPLGDLTEPAAINCMFMKTTKPVKSLLPLNTETTIVPGVLLFTVIVDPSATVPATSLPTYDSTDGS